MFRRHVCAWLHGLPLFFDEPGTGGTGGGGTGTTTDDRKFTQAEVDGIIAQRLKEETERLERRTSGIDPTKIAAEREELERLRRAEADRKRKDDEAKGNYEAALKSKDQEFENERKTYKEQLDKVTGRLRTTTIREKLVAAAAAAGAIKPGQVADLLDRQCKLNDNFEIEIYGEDGKTKLFKSGRDLTPDELVAQYLDDNPHLRKAANTGGSGSQGGVSTHPEGAAKTSDDNTELAQLQKTYEDLAAKAQKTGQHGDATAAHKAKRALDKARAAAATKK